ncbi:hypothetical protein MRB53_038104 [Persea americana]|nr:hypothetical protein MRB53_038104 [Persea americana]
MRSRCGIYEKKAVIYTMSGHSDTITSLQVSPDSSTLPVVFARLDCTNVGHQTPLRRRTGKIKTYDGASVGMEKNLFKASWDASGQRIISGGGSSITIWEARTGRLLHRLPGTSRRCETMHGSRQLITISVGHDQRGGHAQND